MTALRKLVLIGVAFLAAVLLTFRPVTQAQTTRVIFLPALFSERAGAPTATPTASPTASSTPTGTATLTPTATATVKATSSATPTATATSTSTRTPTATSTTKPTATATNTPKPTATPTNTPKPTATATATKLPNCSPAYPTVCIPPPPPDLDCGDIPYRNFTVLPPDPHRFDSDDDGIGCESG